MPSLFTNEYSRGPLYQYWRERGSEETGLRAQRVEEAKLRAKGLKPLDAAYGPSSSESYASREGRGPPAYIGGQSSAAEPVGSGEGDALPAYVDDTESPQDGRGLLSAEEEKSRLARLAEQHQRTQSDAAIARSLSDDLARGDAAQAEGTGKQPERRKSTAGKVGRWFADAASGYTKKQERW